MRKLAAARTEAQASSSANCFAMNNEDSPKTTSPRSSKQASIQAMHKRGRPSDLNRSNNLYARLKWPKRPFGLVKNRSARFTNRAGGGRRIGDCDDH